MGLHVATRPRLCALLGALSLTLAAPAARAQQATPRERFARGVALSEEGDWRAALLEFNAAYEGTRNPEVLFNVAAAHEHLNEYVEALDALERFQRLAAPRAVARHRAEVVDGVRRLLDRVGMLRVATSAPSPRCAVDGVPRPMEVLRDGLRVSVGRRAVRCEAAGFEARAVTVDVASNAVTEALVELPRVRATLAVVADRAGAEVRVDGRAVGVTPLADPVAVDEGERLVEVASPGYDTFSRVVDARGSVRVDATLRWSDPVPPAADARLVVRTNVSGALGSLDGRAVPLDGSRALPPGAHRLRVERDLHVPEERDVTLTAGARAVVDVVLAPTPAWRESYTARARRQRRAWAVVGGAGAVFAAAGGVLLGVSLPRALDADGRAAAADAEFLSCSARGGCGSAVMDRLAATRDTAAAERDAALPLVVAGGVMAGVGVVGLVVGAILWADADPVDGLDRPPTLRVAVGPGDATLLVRF